ncbi:CubicO group peptidase, beta-lactamase class C family [Curtobacterium sp. UNCCL20]|uniref:serine hydrolase domain-containing protein n=1 Tax=Curtobacterium sp. UNCCL20 TaxID=1502773 RepID=UPI000888BEF3|nr:serine hydrolase domain-containing protein [Curtobacterium sp. UNCCL20]SDQ68461.1 CubicO group peptidase, beta-lactamase class C family [Curtobacterium sp. UNCCL20]
MTDALTDVDALFRERVERGTAPSSAWGVFDRTGLIASGGHGDRGDGAAPDADTVYRIASCTKSVTAATLLTLVAQGRLQLDAPVTDFVPAFADVALPTPDSPVPTLRMLLTMAAGFPTDDPWADRQEAMPDVELDGVLRDGLLFDSVPGTRFAYSNLGYALLGRVIAVVAGAPYPEVAAATILRPLGLDDTVFRAAEARGFVVTGVRPHAGEWEPLPMTGPGAFSSIGGLFSTVADLARWGTHLASAFTDHPEPGPVSPADRRLMQQAMRVVPASVVPGSSRATAYGFGLFVEQDARFGELVSHSGGYPGFSAHMRWSVRDGIGVVAFENATQAKVSAAADRALDLVLGSHPGAAATTATTVSNATVPVPTTPTTPTTTAPGTRRTTDATRAARAAVTRLLADWSDDLADAICTPNVAMDVPYERRRQAIAEAVATVGADVTAAPVEEQSSAPSHVRWWLPGTAGRLRVEIRLAPLAAGRVQTLSVTAEPTER